MRLPAKRVKFSLENLVVQRFPYLQCVMCAVCIYTDNCFQRMTQFLINVTPNGRPGRGDYPYFHSKAARLRVNLVAAMYIYIGRGYEYACKRGVCVDIREKITNDHWASRGRGTWRSRWFEILRSLRIATTPFPPVGYRFLLVFHSVPPKNHKFHSSFFLSSPLTLSLTPPPLSSSLLFTLSLFFSINT